MTSYNIFRQKLVYAKEEKDTWSLKPIKDALFKHFIGHNWLKSRQKVKEHWVCIEKFKGGNDLCMSNTKAIIGDQNELGQNYKILRTANYQFEWAW